MRTISKINNLVAATMLIAVFAFVAIACGQEAAPTETPRATSDQSEPILPEAPDFTLPAANRDNAEISLSSFQGSQPVVLVFYRAYWWGFCTKQLGELQKHYSKISDAGAEVLAISTDDLRGAESIVAKAVAEFPVLYTNKNNDVPISYNVFDLFGDGLASASVFIVDKNGNIAYENIGENYRHQVSGEEVLKALNGL